MKTLLIATTALVCVASFAVAGTLPERQTAPGYSGQDANAEFLCNYGFKLYTSISASSGIEYWHRAATPVRGNGKRINEIAVEDGPSHGKNPRGFRIAIYSSSRDRPYNELAGASATQKKCGVVHVPISPITLKKGTKYWVVQTASEFFPDLASSSRAEWTSGVWHYDRKRTGGALSQSCYSSCSDSYSYSFHAWKRLAGGVPYARVGFSRNAQQLNPAPQLQGARVGDGSLSPMIVPRRRGGHEGGTPRYPP